MLLVFTMVLLSLATFFELTWVLVLRHFSRYVSYRGQCILTHGTGCLERPRYRSQAILSRQKLCRRPTENWWFPSRQNCVFEVEVFCRTNHQLQKLLFRVCLREDEDKFGISFLYEDERLNGESWMVLKVRMNRSIETSWLFLSGKRSTYPPTLCTDLRLILELV